MPRSLPRRDRARLRFEQLLALIDRRDKVRCDGCKKPGFLDELRVEADPRTRELTYSATWAHPHGHGEDRSDSLCEWIL
jgi:hypothetical protein